MSPTATPRVLSEYEDWPPGPVHLCIGEFDGVHIGHQAALAQLCRGAEAAGATALAMTFDPIPVELFVPELRSALTGLDERVRLLLAAGAGAVTVMRFDEDFSHQLPDEFVQHIIDACDLRRIVVGPDFRFGYERQGDVRTLAGIGARNGFAVDVVETVQLGERIVSASLIRNALLSGDVADAARLLGRPFTVAGHAVGRRRDEGEARPAVDIALPADRLLPRDGVYAAWAGSEAGGRLPAVADLMLWVTPGGQLERHLEVRSIQGDPVPHGATVEITFVHRLRDEMRFPSVYDHTKQTVRDMADALAALHG
ncbi:MAG: bifunctional riboflavin kinase/FAD synthetase [Chloroflexi bacterium]|nr:bifunctional riboflavin kinase/FAD synthetase [Chloroflexota bacterium]